MYRHTPRNVTLSASSSEFGYSNKLKTPSTLKNEARKPIRNIDSWMTVDQNEEYVGNKSGKGLLYLRLTFIFMLISM